VKTNWDMQRLERLYGVRGSKEWAAAKCKAYAQHTGVPWCWASYNGRVHLAPYLDKLKERISEPPVGAQRLEQVLYRQAAHSPMRLVSLLQLQCVMDLPLATVARAATWLIQQGKAAPNVNRTGHVTMLSPRY
jgi:hypothetical protein